MNNNDIYFLQPFTLNEEEVEVLNNMDRSMGRHNSVQTMGSSPANLLNCSSSNVPTSSTMTQPITSGTAEMANSSVEVPLNIYSGGGGGNSREMSTNRHPVQLNKRIGTANEGAVVTESSNVSSLVCQARPLADLAANPNDYYQRQHQQLHYHPYLGRTSAFVQDRRHSPSPTPASATTAADISDFIKMLQAFQGNQRIKQCKRSILETISTEIQKIYPEISKIRYNILQHVTPNQWEGKMAQEKIFCKICQRHICSRGYRLHLQHRHKLCILCMTFVTPGKDCSCIAFLKKAFFIGM